MSLAVLARKTRAKQKLRKRGKFILNMTGRGNVLGMNAKMSRGNCKGLTTCAGKRAACCVGVGGSQCCEFPHGGQPAPQQSYRVYLNRKSKGAYRPAGGKQCKDLSGCKQAKSVWKQGSNLDAGEITRKRRDNTLACYTDVYTAKKDTCTGCPDQSAVGIGTSTNTLLVGWSSTLAIAGGLPQFVGVKVSGSPLNPPGSITPNNINGVQIVSIVYTFTFDQTPPTEFSPGLEITLRNPGTGTTSTNLPADFFTSISFVDGNNVRTYLTSQANYTPASLPPPSPFDQTNTKWVWTATPLTNAAGTPVVSPTTVLGPYTKVEEIAYWAGAANNPYVPGGVIGKTLGVIFEGIILGKKCCCPVKKNICGCRATDLVRYTRINKSFGCQTTKAVRMGRTASEQIARRRAAVDCIKPKHRTIYIDITNSDGALKVNGCCGNQCLIQGQQYTFVFKSVYGSIYSGTDITLRWCPGLEEKISSNDTDTSQGISFTVPKFNKNCQPATEAIIGKGDGLTGVSLSYCKKAFKTPQMLGSCSGR